MIALPYMHHDFAVSQRMLRMTPAMEAAADDHMSSRDEIGLAD